MIKNDPLAPIPTWPLPWTVDTVQQRFAQQKRRGQDFSRSNLNRAEATAILRDAVNQGQAKGRIDLGVIDDSLKMYLTYRDTTLENG